MSREKGREEGKKKSAPFDRGLRAERPFNARAGGCYQPQFTNTNGHFVSRLSAAVAKNEYQVTPNVQTIGYTIGPTHTGCASVILARPGECTSIQPAS